MGTIINEAILVSGGNYLGDNIIGKVIGWRAGLEDDWQSLVVGPVQSIINQDFYFVFLPDGSKEGWDISDYGDKLRAEFIDLFTDTYWHVVYVKWGETETNATDADNTVLWKERNDE